jgi:hypothetical protein
MPQWMPFGAETLVIPFGGKLGGDEPRHSGGMSRLRRAGELYRHGVAPSPDAGDGPERSYAPVPRRRDRGFSAVSDRHREQPSEKGEAEEELREATEAPGLIPHRHPDGSELLAIPAPIGGPGGVAGARAGGAAAPLLPGAASDTGDPATESQRSNLRRSIMQTGMLAPDDPRQAHHIVPGAGR